MRREGEGRDKSQSVIQAKLGKKYKYSNTYLQRN